ncbi:protein NLRC5-like [Neolamprologus brichardi]|uniref:protein NLRC5-like n=1 Tax=Neolamprologus brichardi TaxID=32507 RepID=UPI0003EC6571|nr:protein NLRC5-like [Neolamprologus brichardi]
MSSCLNIQHVHAEGIKDLTVTFFQKSDMNSHTSILESTISLLNQNWNKSEMQKLAESLARCPALSVLDVSGGQWDEEILRTLTEFLPKFSITDKLIINDSCSSVEGLVVLTALLSDYPPVMELHIRLQVPVKVSIVFARGREKPASGISKSLCASKNDINMEGVAMLAAALCSYNTLTEIHISGGGKEEVNLKFCPDESDDKQQLKMFRVKDSSILPSDITKVCRKLVQSHFHWELELSQCSLTNKAIKNLLKVLPEMTSLQRLNVRQSITSATDALELVSCLNDSQRVTSVELSPQGDSFINFDTVKVEQVSCRLTHFCLKGDHLKKLLEILQQGPQLSDLDLSSNQLEDEDVSSFVHSLPRLKISTYVNLSNNRLTQQGLLAVASTLCTCANVSGVDVSLGEEERCLIWFRQNETREKTLRLNHSLLEQTEDFLQLLSFSQSGCVFSIEERWISAEKAVGLMLHCLQLNSNIQTFRIHQNTLHLTNSTGLTTDSDLSGNAAQSSAIKKIGLVDCAVNVHQLASIESVILSCPFLTELDFSHNSLGVEGAEFLCSVLPRLPNLTSLRSEPFQI